MADRGGRPNGDIDQLSEAIHSLCRSLDCTICLELMREPTKTRCGHSFCKICIATVLRKKSACCPLCKKSLNRRNISKDDHLQICIEGFKKLVTAIQIDSHIDILSHSKQPRDTKESCSYPDARQSSRDSNKEKPKKERSIRQLNQNNKQTVKPSTSRETMIDCDKPRYDLNVSDEKPESNLSRAFSGEKNDSPVDIKIRTWVHSFPDKPSTDWITENEMLIEDKARTPMNLMPDDNGRPYEVCHGFDARSSQGRKRSTDCPKRIDEDDTLSQVNKEARQIGEVEVIEIDSAASGLKYNASHARIRAEKSHEKVARRSDIEETVDQGNSSSAITYDRIATSTPLSTSAITEQSTTNWSRMIEFGKEMKHTKGRRKIKKLNVSTEKNKNLPRIVESITLSPNSRYNSIRTLSICNKSENVTASISNQLESDDQKRDATDKRLDPSDTKVTSLTETNSQTELRDKTDNSKSTYSTMNTSYIMLEEGRKVHIMNLNNDQMKKIIGFKNSAGDSQNQRSEENEIGYCDSSRARVTLLTPEKLNESLDEIICDVSQTSTANYNFRSSSHLPAEKLVPAGLREASNVRGTSASEAASSRSPTPNKTRLSLRRKPKSVDSPPSSDLPLSYRLSIGKHEENVGDRKSVDSPVSMDDELLDRLKVVRRDLNFRIIYEDQQQTDAESVDTHPESPIEVEDSDGNVPGIVRQDGRFSRNSAGKSTASRKSVSTRSRNAESRGHRSLVKFMQLSTLIRRRNIKYFSLGPTKREQSMPAEIRVASICNVQQVIPAGNSEAAAFNLWNDSQNSSTVEENACFASNSNSNEAIPQELPAASPSVFKASTPNVDSHLNREEGATIVRSSNQRSDKSLENVAGDSARALHESVLGRAIHGTVSHTCPGTSRNSIKLLSPDKDSQLKFLQIDSPMSEKLRRANSIKSAIKGNNFPEMESSQHFAASTLAEALESFIESSRKKRKRVKCASDRELSEDRSISDSSDSVSSQATVKLDRYGKLPEELRSSRSDANKKRRLSSPDEQDVEILMVSEEQDAPGKKFVTSSSDTESESVTHSDDQCIQRNASIMDTAAKKCLARRASDEDHRIRNIVDKWSNEHDVTRKKLTRKSKTSQSSVKSVRGPPEESAAGDQSRSSDALKIEKRRSAKSSQKSSARESYLFESNSLFNSENLDYILQQQPTNADETSKKIVDSSNDDIINRVLRIDRSRSNPGACRSPVYPPWNDIGSRTVEDNRECLLQDNFDEIIASVEQPQSEDFIPCTEQPNDRSPNRPSAKRKTSGCLATTDELCAGAAQGTPIVTPSSTHDMFEYRSPGNVRKSHATSNSDKENVACSQKRHGADRKDGRDATANADAIDKDCREKIVSRHNASREREKSVERRNASIQSAGRLHIDDDGETQRVTITGDRSNSKDDTFGHDSLMNITQHQAQLRMFEEDLFGIAARNQTRARKMISQDPSPKEQCTPRKRKQNKNTEPGERSDEDDVVESTPEKKIKNNNGSNIKSIESRESTKIKFLSPRTSERTPTASRPGQIVRPFLADGNTPTNHHTFEMRPSSQSTPIAGNTSVIMANRSDVIGDSRRTERVESGSILLTRQVDMKTLENIRRLPDRRDLCFVCSGLSTIQLTIVKEFAARYNANYVNQFERDVTHVIVRTTGEQNAANSTLKYLQGIAHRKWVVSFRWIEDCIRQQRLLDEVPYEATMQIDTGINGAGPRNSRLREKGLFEGFTFLCVGPYDNVSLSQYQDLLIATGATVVEFLDVFANMEGMKGILIQENAHDDKTIEHWYRTAKAAPILVDWIVECIGHYKLFKLAPYIPCLSLQDLCAIGYPRELVEDDEEYSDDE